MKRTSIYLWNIAWISVYDCRWFSASFCERLVFRSHLEDHRRYKREHLGTPEIDLLSHAGFWDPGIFFLREKNLRFLLH